MKIKSEDMDKFITDWESRGKISINEYGSYEPSDLFTKEDESLLEENPELCLLLFSNMRFH